MKQALVLALTALLTVSVSAQEKPRPRSIVLPGPSHIDVETLNKRIDLNTDADQLTLSEARVLRNAFAARQGYLFRSADLRSIFMQTSWYASLMQQRWQQEQERGRDLPVNYTKEELAFIRKLKLREAKLLQQNFTDSQHPNLSNLINGFQADDLSLTASEALKDRGFAIISTADSHLFSVYERNRQQDFPSFVTIDLYLQLSHLYFDWTQREVELSVLHPLMSDFCRQMQAAMSRLRTSKSKEVRSAADYLELHFATPSWLQTASFRSDRTEQLSRLAVAAYAVGHDDSLRTTYQQLQQVTAYLMGASADVTLLQVHEAIRRIGLPLEKLLKNKKKMVELRAIIEVTAEHQATDPETSDDHRCTIHLIHWQESTDDRWQQSLKPLLQADAHLPYFMQTAQWQQRSRILAEAPWRESDTPTSLTLPQQQTDAPSEAPEAPVVRAYVEPNIAYWQRAIELLDATQQSLDTYGLCTERISQLTDRLRQEVTFLLNVSEKELDGERLSDQEYRQVNATASALGQLYAEMLHDAHPYVRPETTGTVGELYVVVPVESYLYLMRGAAFAF